jgi:hypothetical protein
MLLEIIGLLAVAYVITGVSFELVIQSMNIPLQGQEQMSTLESIFFGALFGVPVMLMTAYSILSGEE